MKNVFKKLLSVLMVLAILLVPMTVLAETGDSEEPWQLTVSDPMFPSRPMSVYVEPGDTQWVQAADMFGTVTVGYATGEYMLMYGRMPVYPETESGDYTAELQLQGYDIFSIYNPSETDGVVVYMTLTSNGPAEIPLGSYDNPEILEASGAYVATVEEGTDGYFYEFVAPSYGKVTVTIEDETGWQYVVNKTPVDEEDYGAYYNGDWHWSDDEEVVASEEIVVYAGETVKVQVNTYAPGSWIAPAGSVNWSFAFEASSVFMVSDAESYAGGEFDVAINLENNPGIISLKLDVAYDSEVLELVGVAGGDFTGATDEDLGTVNGFSFGPLTNNPIAVNWIDPLLEENNTSNGTVATLTFKVKEGVECDSETAISITYDAENVFDVNFNNVEIGTIDGTVTVGHSLIAIDEVPATCTETGIAAHDKCEICGKLFNWGWEVTEEELVTDPYHDRYLVDKVEPTTTSTGMEEHYECNGCDGLWIFDMDFFEFEEVTAEEITIPMLEPEFTYGDLSGDGKVNNKDLGLLMQKLNGWDVEINMDAADVNGDGKVNNKDYGLLMQYLNGWDVTLG